MVGEEVAAGAMTGLTRLPLDIQPQEDLSPLSLPINLLALLSSPLDLEDHERLAIEQEQEILLRAINSPVGQGRLKVVFEDESKLPIIENTLESGFQIFHYSGHGIGPKHGGGLLLCWRCYKAWKKVKDTSGWRYFVAARRLVHYILVVFRTWQEEWRGAKYLR